MRARSRIKRERDFVKTLGPKYGNACLPLCSRAGASCAGRYTNPDPHVGASCAARWAGFRAGIAIVRTF